MLKSDPVPYGPLPLERLPFTCDTALIRLQPFRRTKERHAPSAPASAAALASLPRFLDRGHCGRGMARTRPVLRSSAAVRGQAPLASGAFGAGRGTRSGRFGGSSLADAGTRRRLPSGCKAAGATPPRGSAALCATCKACRTTACASSWPECSLIPLRLLPAAQRPRLQLPGPACLLSRPGPGRSRCCAPWPARPSV